MGKITEKEVAQDLLESAHVLVTQAVAQEDGSTIESLRRIPLSVFLKKCCGVGTDDTDMEEVERLINEYLRKNPNSIVSSHDSAETAHGGIKERVDKLYSGIGNVLMHSKQLTNTTGLTTPSTDFTASEAFMYSAIRVLYDGKEYVCPVKYGGTQMDSLCVIGNGSIVPVADSWETDGSIYDYVYSDTGEPFCFWSMGRTNPFYLLAPDGETHTVSMYGIPNTPIELTPYAGQCLMNGERLNHSTATSVIASSVVGYKAMRVVYDGNEFLAPVKFVDDGVDQVIVVGNGYLYNENYNPSGSIWDHAYEDTGEPFCFVSFLTGLALNFYASDGYDGHVASMYGMSMIPEALLPETVTHGGGFAVQDTPPDDTSLLWVDTSDNSQDEESPDDPSNFYTRDEIDAIMGAYITDIDALIGGDS